MDLKIFAVYDKKAQAHAHPFYFHHKGEAIRAFEDECNNSQSRLNKHPEDFSLFLVGEWDDRTGVIKPFTPPVFVEEALAVIHKEEKRG